MWSEFLTLVCLSLRVRRLCTIITIYRKISDISRALVNNEIVDHSNVVGASPVGAAPTASSFSTWHLASRDSAKKAARQYDNFLSVGIWCDLYYRLDGNSAVLLHWGPVMYMSLYIDVIDPVDGLRPETFQKASELLNLRTLKNSTLDKICIFQCMGEIFCVEFQRYPSKFHTKYLTRRLKGCILDLRARNQFRNALGKTGTTARNSAA